MVLVHVLNIKKLNALHSRISNSIHFVFINLKFRIVRGGYCQRGVSPLSCLYPPLTQSYLILFLKIMKSHTKDLWFVCCEINHERIAYHIYAYSGCHAMQLYIKYLHEVLSIPLDDIDISHKVVYKIEHFIR